MRKGNNKTGRDKMNVLSMNRSQVVEFLRVNVKGAQVVTVDLDSDMDGKGKMRKTGNAFHGLGMVKRQTLNGMIGYIYANSVNRIADKEGKDERNSKPHAWGDMDSEHLFRWHRKTGKPYLSMKVENVTVHGFFLPDGTQIERSKVKPFLPEKRKSSTQADLEGEVIARDYNLDNITAIRMKGVEIRLVD